VSDQFGNTSLVFEGLCRQFRLPVPRIRPALPTDPGDFTSAEEVRLNVAAHGGTDFVYHARHVFGHYVCDLHAADPDRSRGWADKAASLITDLIDRVS